MRPERVTPLHCALEGLPDASVAVRIAQCELMQLEGNISDFEALLEAAFAGENYAELPLGYELLTR